MQNFPYAVAAQTEPPWHSDDWKHAFPEVPWRQVADLGNFIRHAYHKIDLDVLWAIYTDDLDRVESAVDRLLQRTRAPRPDL